jgi:hypothetical protein
LNSRSTQLACSAQLPRFTAGLLRAALVLTLLFAQAVSLNHTHNGDLNDRVDCDICLKIGSNDDALISASSLPVIKASSTVYSLEPSSTLGSALIRATARAPPLA